jgi:hypothetical protein
MALSLLREVVSPRAALLRERDPGPARAFLDRRYE